MTHDPERLDADRLERLLEGQVDDSVEARDLSAFLELSRRSLEDTSDWAPKREAALVEDVLARTTREDLSLRGELRLIGRFVRERLSRSAALRVLAASVLLHLCIVPVVGMLAWREAREPGFRIEFRPQPTEELPFEVADDETPERAADEDAERTRAHLANAAARHRLILSTTAEELPLEAGDDSLETALIEARSRFLAERAWTEWLDERQTWIEASPLAQVLLAELLIDRLLFEDTRPPQLAPLLHRLEEASPAADAAVVRLREALLDRARVAGALPSDAGFDPRTVPLPLASAWCEDLVEACASLPAARAAEAFVSRAR